MDGVRFAGIDVSAKWIDVASGTSSPPPSPLWARTAAEHHAAYLQAFRLAELQLRSAAKGHRRPWAVILDIDETLLDTSEHELERWRTSTPFSKPGFIE